MIDSKLELWECYRRGLDHGSALASPAARLRAVPVHELGRAAWGDEDIRCSTWEEEREEAELKEEDDRGTTPYGLTCAEAERVRERLLQEVEREDPKAAPARAVLVAIAELAQAVEAGAVKPEGLAAAVEKLEAAEGCAWLARVLQAGVPRVFEMSSTTPQGEASREQQRGVCPGCERLRYACICPERLGR